jgi:hypothetical protein
VTIIVLDQSLVTLKVFSKEVLNAYKLNLRESIKKYKGVSQKNLICNLNPIICSWILSKRTQLSSKILSELDTFTYFHLWNWARKRHPKMSHKKIKDKYWHTVGHSNWVFGIKSKEPETGGTKVTILLQKHCAIKLETHLQVIETEAPKEVNVDCCAKRSGANTFLSLTLKS